MTTVGDQLYQFGGVPVGADLYTGNTFFVDSGAGSNSNTGKKPSTALADIDYAIGKCTANNGDHIFVMEGHSETANTQITCDVAGVSIIGLGRGAARPTVTADASAADCFNVTAASVYIENIKIVGAASCTALLNLAAADFVAKGVVFQQVATPLMGVTVASGGDRFTFEDCLFYGLVDGPDCGIDLEAKSAAPNIVRNCIFNYGPAGLDLAGIRSDAKAVNGFFVTGCTFIGMALTAIDINCSDIDGGDGIISYNAMSSGGTVANIDTFIDAGGCVLIENHGSDTNGEAGGLVPVTTPA
jgi:hypothetical protein